MKIRIGQEWFSTDQWNDLATGGTFNPAIQHAVNFVSDWLKGKRQFSFSTSGSTGAPKSVSFTREQLITSARMTQQVLGLHAGETALVCLDTRFIAGAMMLVRGLVTEMDLILLEPGNNPFREYKGTCDFIALVPLQVVQIMSETPERLHQVRNIIIGGAPIDERLQQELRPFDSAVFATYGMTETITHVALQRLSGPSATNYFEALPGITFEKDERGCLVIHAPHLPGPIVTNDVANLIDPGHFQWRGRIDNIINTGGIKVQKEALEQIISSILHSSNIRLRYFIDSMPDLSLGSKIVLVMEGQPLSPSQETEILDEIRKATDRFHVPKALLYIDHFEETATQKIDRLATMKRIAG